MSHQQQMARLLDELRKEGITDFRVLDAMESVPRELFVPPEWRGQAFRNIPLPIGEGQTISQPFVVALMSQALSLDGTESVLEVGTGSGYQCAILAELSRKVVSIERLEPLAASARAKLAFLGYQNVEVLVGDGTLRRPELGLLDAILVAAGGPRVPDALVEQLVEGGRLVIPIGSAASQELVLYVRKGDSVVPHRLGSVRFVPLIGEAGWTENS